MLKIDHFASVFRAADKEIISIREREISKVLIVTDVNHEKSLEIWERWRSLFVHSVDVVILHGETSRDISTITQKVEEAECDLIISYRCLHSDNWKYPHAVGSYIEVMTQLTSKPVLLMPHVLEDTREYAPPESIVLISDDLTKEADLLGWACSFRGSQARCTLVELHNEAHFHRMMDVIAKIPQIDTEVAKDKIYLQLQKDSLDWVSRSQEIVGRWERPLSLQRTEMAQSCMTSCTELVQKEASELIVLNTKDEDQLAIHGLVYPFMVQFRHVPLLLR